MKAKNLTLYLCLAIFWFLLPACTPAQSISPDAASLPTSIHATSTAEPIQDENIPGLTREQIATLRSLEKLDDYPFYSMHYAGVYQVSGTESTVSVKLPASWGCSLFAALGDPESKVYGRNFDWEYSPALLLYTDPPDGHASISMVNLGFLHNWGEEVRRLDELPLAERQPLLRTPYLPIDGMNESGLVVGLAAVPASPLPFDADKGTIGSLGVMREMLDHAQDVSEAVNILGSYNMDWSGGPPVHYLLADRQGNSALVEFYQSEMVVLRGATPWQQATNFLVSAHPGDPAGHCWRYDAIDRELEAQQGSLTPVEALDLLVQVSQSGTQWSLVYSLVSGDLLVTLGRDYQQVYSFQLN